MARRVGWILCLLLVVAVAVLARQQFGLGGKTGPARDGVTGEVTSDKTDIQNLILISIDTLRADHLGCYG